MRDCSRRGDIILDTFLGSGTPFMAAERIGRRGFGMEIDLLYVDVAIRRYQARAKRDASFVSRRDMRTAAISFAIRSPRRRAPAMMAAR